MSRKANAFRLFGPCGFLSDERIERETLVLFRRDKLQSITRLVSVEAYSDTLVVSPRTQQTLVELIDIRACSFWSPQSFPPFFKAGSF